MRIAYLDEPELQFCSGRHIDIRFGITHFAPFDSASSTAPKNIQLGLIGTPESVESLREWLDKCRTGIRAKASPKPNLFPTFPGFSEECSFRASLVQDDRLVRTVKNRDLEVLMRSVKQSELVHRVADVFVDEIKSLLTKANPDVIVCAPPADLVTHMSGEVPDDLEDGDEVKDWDTGRKLDFHDLLKAKSLGLGKPLQLILPTTYGPAAGRRKPKRLLTADRELQDEATRAWNLHCAFYYKAGGLPWRLVQQPGGLATCYVGVSFYRTLDEESLVASSAQVFDERGDGIIVRGGIAELSKDDLQPHLSRKDAAALLCHVLKVYRAEHKTTPARLVLHKSSSFSTQELDGFREAASNQSIEYCDFLTVGRTCSRLFRDGSYPPLRGTFLSLDERTQMLYTRGSVDFFETYPGLYVPMPLRFKCEMTDNTPRALAEEILALTKMNWNNTQFDGGEPITLRAARKVGKILKYVEDKELVQHSYRFFM